MSAGGGSSGGAGALNRMALSRDRKAASLILEERITGASCDVEGYGARCAFFSAWRRLVDWLRAQWKLD